MLQHDRLAGRKVGRDGAKRNRQVIEAVQRRDRQQRIAQFRRKLLALDQPLGHLEVAMPVADRHAHQEVAIIFLASKVQVGTARAVAKRVGPIERSHQLFDLAGPHPGGIQPADHGTDTRAGDGIDGYVHRFQGLEYADVRGTARPAARQDKADARPGPGPRTVSVDCAVRCGKRGQRVHGEGNDEPGADGHEGASQSFQYLSRATVACDPNAATALRAHRTGASTPHRRSHVAHSACRRPER